MILYSWNHKILHTKHALDKKKINCLAEGRVGGGEWTSLDYPWMVTFTLASTDPLTRGWGRVNIPGLLRDGHHSYSGIRGYSEWGGSEGWTSLDYPWMVTDTLSSTNTLTWVGGERGHPWTIHGWSHLLWHLQILWHGLLSYLCSLLPFLNNNAKKKGFWMKTSVCRGGTLKNQPKEMGMTPQHFHTIPTSCSIHVANYMHTTKLSTCT